jgi:hypothetical protein
VLSAPTIALRQACVVDYLTALEEAAHVFWLGARDQADSLARRLVLIHPGWHEGDVSRALQLVPFTGTLRGGRCHSERLWGYRCPLSDMRIEADHIFPMALGGPAKGTNQVWLCSLHNGWKSSDLLAFPWEEEEPAWLGAQLEQVEALLPEDSRWSRS